MKVQSLASLSGSSIQCCRELWCRLQTRLISVIAVAVVWPAAIALIQPLALKLPYAPDALKDQKKKKKSKYISNISFIISTYNNRYLMLTLTKNSRISDFIIEREDSRC